METQFCKNLHLLKRKICAMMRWFLRLIEIDVIRKTAIKTPFF